MTSEMKYSIKKSVIFFITLICVIIFSTISISYSSLTEENIKYKSDFFKPVIIKLLSEKVDSAFINMLLSDPNTNFNEKYIKINVIGFLKKPSYSGHYDNSSVIRVSDFIKENINILTECEKKYGIPKEIISSILWIETKFGDFLGRNHIPSVLLSAAMADCEEYISLNKQRLYDLFDGDSTQLFEMYQQIERRAKKKSKWALEELKALEKIYHRKQIDIFELHGSWAGAFGLSQFLPSSYVKWAVDGNNDSVIDLFDKYDAIFSIANYLTVNGWDSDSSMMRKALFHYNNSEQYVDAVLKLSARVTGKYETLEPLDLPEQ